MTVYSVSIYADSVEQMATLRAMKLDLHDRAARRRPGSGEYSVPGLITNEQIEQLRADDYRVIVHADAEQLAVERMAGVAPDVNRLAPAHDTADRRRDATSATPDVPGEYDGAVEVLERMMDLSELDAAADGPAGRPRTVQGGYLTADEVESAIQALASRYPDLATVSELPEQTWDGRTVHVLRIRAGSGAARPGVLITGGVHAREWGGSDICVAFATNLLKAYQSRRRLRYGNKSFSAAQVRSILEHLDVFVFPDVNPDGKAYSQSVDPGQPQGFWWRKNRRRTGMPAGAEGVDINRNFDFLWSSGIGTTTDATEFTYKGPAPFSEPESRNVASLFDAHPNIGYYVDVHSSGELILYSWGDDENQSNAPDQNFLNGSFDGQRGVVGDTSYKEYIVNDDRTTVVNLARAMNRALTKVRGKRYMVDQAVGLYPTSATSDDYAFSRHHVDPTRGKIYGFTIEFGDQFVPSYSEMRPVMADVAAALTELCRLAAVET